MNRCSYLASAGFIAALGALYLGCSSAPGAGGQDESEGTGEVSAAIETVPADTRCITLSLVVYGATYAYRNVQQDVVPGESAVIHVGGLPAGYGYVSGQAYASSCSEIYGFEAGSSQTWYAEQVYFYVQPGRSTDVQLNFHHLGGVTIGVNFDECSCDQYGNCTIIDDAGTVTACQPAGGGGGGGGEGGVGFGDAAAPAFDGGVR